MLVAGAQCMCDRSYGEDDAEDDEAEDTEDTGYGQHRARDLLKLVAESQRDRGEHNLDPSRDNNESTLFDLFRFFGKRQRSFRAEGRSPTSASRNVPGLTQSRVHFTEVLRSPAYQRRPERL